MAVTRDEHYRDNSAIRTEAVVLVLLELINPLRQEQGLPVITHQEFMALVDNHASHLEPYDWMKRFIPGE